MPTQKRRLMLNLSDELYDLVHRLSELGGQSMSAIVVEMLDASRPIFESLISAAENYQQLDASKRADMLAALEAAEARILPEADRLQRETLDAFEGKTRE